MSVLKRVEDRGSYDVAARVRGNISEVFKYAIISAQCETNPADHLAGALKTRPVKHRTALPIKEIHQFYKKLDGFDGRQLTRLAIELIILTFVRSTELREARWSEFELEGDNPMWRIPAERMKMNREHIVPLCPQAVDIINQIKRLDKSDILVFPSRHRPGTIAMSSGTMMKAIRLIGYGGTASVHGFRAMASTTLNENNFKPDVIERQLAHVEKNKVRAAYSRSEYLPDRKDMMNWWGNHLGNLRTNSNVVQGRFGSAG